MTHAPLLLAAAAVVASASASVSAARRPPPPPPPAVLAECDASSADQKWSLADGNASFGQPNTFINYQTDCLDVANRDTGDKQAVRAWQCCCVGHPYCGHCGNAKLNFNQAYALDAKGRVVTGEKMGGRCLSVTSGPGVLNDAIVTLSCDEAAPGAWLVYSAAAPHLRWAGNTSLCLATTGGPSPGPSPSPPRPPRPPSPSGPYEPVPQACTTANTTGLPFCDSTLSPEARTKDLLARMTTAEKLTQLIGGIGGGITPAIGRLGLPPYQYHSEGLHGIRTTCGLGRQGLKLWSTMYPQVTGMAATGNLTLIKEMAAQMADEARAVNNYMKGNTVGRGGGLNYWGPTMNIVRDPRWGRSQESVSEDPWLNGAYAVRFVQGLQGTNDGVKQTKIAACCKHFFAYSLENADGFTRHTFDAKVNSRDLTESYNTPFAMCVAAQPEQIMCSYNEVNGVPTCLDDAAQNGYLRRDLGWDGVIFSDCDAVGDAYKTHKYSKSFADAAATGIKNGCDMDCGSTYKSANLEAAMAGGMLNVSDVDVALGRALVMKMRLGMFDAAATVPYTSIGLGVLNSAHGQASALRAAQEAIVLLKNGAGALPLKGAAMRGKTVAVVGPLATSTAVMMGGKSDYCPEHTVSVCEGMTNRSALFGVAVTCSSGPDTGAGGMLEAAAGADVVIGVFGGIFGHEAADRVNISLPAEQEAQLDALLLANPNMILVIVNGDPIAIDKYKETVHTIVDAMEGGQAAGAALASVLYGDVSPSGMLPFTIYPADYVTKVPMSDMTFRPNKGTGSPGKTYRFYEDEPLWPFGFSLSYTTFALGWAGTQPAATQSTAALKQGLSFSVAVKNTGAVASGKTVQMYLSTPSVAGAPTRTLIALAKIHVGAGATTTVTLSTAEFANFCAFCLVDEAGKASIPPGTRYAVSIGDGAADFFAPVNITATA